MSKLLSTLLTKVTEDNIGNMKVINISNLCFMDKKGTYTFNSTKVYGIVNVDTGDIYSYDGLKPYDIARQGLLRFIDKDDQWYLGNHMIGYWMTPVQR